MKGMSDLLGSGRIRVEFVTDLPKDANTPPVELELVRDESVSDDLAAVLPAARERYKVTRWPTGLVDVEKSEDGGSAGLGPGP